MTLNLGSWTIEITATHAYGKAMGWEWLIDFTGQTGSSLNRTA